MASLNVPSPLAYQPPAPRREHARAKESSAFAQNLAKVAANQNAKSQEPKEIDIATEPARAPKRGEKTRPPRDQDKIGSTKRAGLDTRNNAIVDGATEAVGTPKNVGEVAPDHGSKNQIHAKETKLNQAEAITPNAEDQSSSKIGDNLETTDETNTPINTTSVITHPLSPELPITPEKQDVENKASSPIDAASTKLNVASAAMLSSASLLQAEGDGTLDFTLPDRSVARPLHDDQKAETAIFENKTSIPKTLNAVTGSDVSPSLLALLSDIDKKNELNTSAPLIADTDHDKGNARSDEIKAIFLTSENDSQGDEAKAATPDLVPYQTIETHATPFAPLHSATPTLNTYPAPLMASGRIVYPSLPYSRVPMEIGLAALEGQRSIQVRLSPADLGTIDIALDVSDQSEATAHISADDPRTLAMLKQDAPFIRQALEQTGLSTNSDSLNFSLRQDGQSNARQNPNEQRPSSARSQKQDPLSDNNTPMSASPPAAPLRRMNNLLDLNI
ncbi:MAG: flagellar hook-length control protein FliK [Alphaproteobacteria bacterium]